MDTIRNLELIIARYKEDVSWINNIKHQYTITIYNKFYNNHIQLPNVGREGHSYLYHIYYNYENLSDINLFSQGDPIFHDSIFTEKINRLNLNELDVSKPLFFGASGVEGVYGNNYHKHPNGLPMYYFLDLLFNIKCKPSDELNINYGAIFLVSKKLIHNRPRNFYKFLLNLLSSEKDPIEGYIIERLWSFIFDSTLPLSNKYITLTNTEIDF